MWLRVAEQTTRSPVHRGGTILDSTMSVADWISSVNPDSRPTILQPGLQANHLAAERLPGENLVFTGLPAGKLAEAGSGHGNMRTRFVFVLPGLSATRQGLAMLGPVKCGSAGILQSATSAVCRRAAARRQQRQRADHLRPQVSAQDVRAGTGAMERRGHARFPERPCPRTLANSLARRASDAARFVPRNR